MLKSLVIAAATFSASFSFAQPLTTAFTFQGELNNGAAGATGTYDFRFTLFDASTGGTQLGPQLCSDNLTIANGKVAVQLDFGPQFAGQQRFLEVQVRQDTGLNCTNATGFVALSPRQNLTAQPNAVFALNAGAAASAGSSTLLNGQPGSYYTDASNLSGTLSASRLPVPLNYNGSSQGASTPLLRINNTAFGFGVGLSSSASGVGIKGVSSQTTGQAYGGQFESNSDLGTAVLATANNGAYGVHAIASGPFSFGVFGECTSSTGSVIGVYGNAGSSPDGTGVFGAAWKRGVYGVANGTEGNAIEGSAPYGAFAGYFTGRGYFSDNLGLGTLSPAANLHVSRGSSGVTPHANAAAVVEGSGTTYLNLLAADASETGILFGRPGAYAPNSAAAIMFNSSGNTDGLQLRTGSNPAARLSIAADGMVHIANRLTIGGDPTAYEMLHVSAGGGGYSGIVADANDTSFGGQDTRAITGVLHGLYGAALYGIVPNDSSTGYACGLIADTRAMNGYAVWGYTPVASAWGVYCTGRLAATGTKSFRIDHPADPENKYLLHYCHEGPEPQNVYNGIATLNEQGEAEVSLPSYFAAINKEPRYMLTAIGAAMPLLHVAQEVDTTALNAGEAVEPGQPIPACSFRIAGGAPGGRVSWELKALRNDRWIQRNGAPVESDKPDFERGTYQHPDLYGQPNEKRPPYAAKPSASSHP